jgi:limonene 1,2-monooxygenase
MGLGALIAPRRGLREDPTVALDRDLALLGLLDRLGFDEVWVGEHHSGGVEIIASPELMIAAASRCTRRIRLGTGVVSLPYYNPVGRRADRPARSHDSRRVTCGVGPGALPVDARMPDIEVRRQRDMWTRLLTYPSPCCAENA